MFFWKKHPKKTMRWMFFSIESSFFQSQEIEGHPQQNAVPLSQLAHVPSSNLLA